MQILLMILLASYVAGRAVWAALFGRSLAPWLPLIGLLVAIEELFRAAEYSWLFGAGLVLYVVGESAVQLLAPFGADRQKSRFVRPGALATLRHARQPSSAAKSDKSGD